MKDTNLSADKTLFPFYTIPNFNDPFVNRKWGFLNSKGKIMLPPTFDYTGTFHEGLAPVVQGQGDEKWGFVDPSGRWVIPEKYVAVEGFNCGRSPVCVGNEEHWGVIDISGNYIVQPGKYSRVYPYSEGMAIMVIGQIGKEGFCQGFIDTNGNVAVSPHFRYVRDFSEGLAAVAKLNPRPQLWGFINKAGDFVVDPSFVAADQFSEGLACVLKKPKAPWDFIDQVGNVIISGVKCEEPTRFSEGLASIISDDGCGFIDKAGKWVIGPTKRYTKVFPFSCGRACFEIVMFKNGEAEQLVGFIDKTGNEVIPAQFFTARNFENDLCWIGLSMRFNAYIDKGGKFIWRADSPH